MIPVQRINEIRSLTATARQYGVDLPSDLSDKAEHLTSLTTRTPALPISGIAADLALHLGNPAAMEKATDKAALAHAAAEARQRITEPLIEQCAIRLRKEIARASEEIVAAFGVAVADALDVLNTDARRLPHGFRGEDAADLTPELFAVWDRVRAAAAKLEGLRAPLAAFYASPDPAMFTVDAAATLRYTQPPANIADVQHAHRIARALAGTQYSGSSVGPLNVSGVFAPAALAHLDCTFAWSSSTEYARRAQQIITAATPRQVTREEAMAGGLR